MENHIITEAEEARLITDAQAGNERAMERLLDVYAPAIEKAARKHQHDGEYEDALQEANLAFITLVQEHDFDKAKRLNYYVHARLGHEMRDSLSATAGQFNIPVRTVQLFWQVYEAADGDLAEGARIAPMIDPNGKTNMSSETFMNIASMLHVGSLDAERQTEGEDGTNNLLDTYDGAPLGGEVAADAYEDVVNRMTVATMLMDAESDDHLRVIRMAYGFEGDLDLGDEVAEMVASETATAAHADGTVAQAMSWQDGTTWSRPKVQRLRTKQLSIWREKYTKADASTGKDN